MGHTGQVTFTSESLTWVTFLPGNVVCTACVFHRVGLPGACPKRKDAVTKMCMCGGQVRGGGGTRQEARVGTSDQGHFVTVDLL